MTTYNDTITEDVTVDDATSNTWTGGTAVGETIQIDDILSPSSGLNETILENANFDDTHPFFIFNLLITLTENIEVSDTLLDDFYALCRESVTLNDTLTNIGTFNYTLSENFTVDDILKVIIKEVITDNITLDDPITAIRRKIAILIDALTVSGAVTSRITAGALISVSLAINDTLSRFFAGDITDALTLDDTFTDLVTFANTLVEDITVAETESHVLTLVTTISEDVTLDDTLSAVGAFAALIVDGATFNVRYALDDTVYTGWVMNPENFAVSNYDNWNFNSIAKIGNKYYAASSSGLYEITGTMDESSYIQITMQTASMDFNTRLDKNVPEVYLGLEMADSVSDAATLVMKVTVEGRTYWYEMTPRDYDNSHMKIGKGLIGRYFQFELVSQNADSFDLDNIEFYPIVLGRRY